MKHLNRKIMSVLLVFTILIGSLIITAPQATAIIIDYRCPGCGQNVDLISSNDAGDTLICRNYRCICYNRQVTEPHTYVGCAPYDNATHSTKCSKCGRAGARQPHNYIYVASVDGNSHTYKCKCGKDNGPQAHTFAYASNGNMTGHNKSCTVCGYSAQEAHSLNYISADTAVCRLCNYTAHRYLIGYRVGLPYCIHYYEPMPGNPSIKICVKCGAGAPIYEWR